MLNETGFKTPLLLNYTQWENGQTGSVGMFEQNGSTSENHRVLADDPWGKQRVVWEARPDSASDADGGWNTDYIAVDSKHYYRFSVWVRRPVVGNGGTYLGCHGSPAVLNLNNGSSNGNPYFWAGGFSYPNWVLIVGHIHPEGTSAGSPIHPDSGLYSAEDGRIGDITTDFIFANGTTTARHRSYLYYSTNTTTRQQWVYPRMDKCDGTEPSIAELLAGHDSRNFDYVKQLGGNTQQAMSIDSEVKVGGVSEVGITNGLVAYYPLNKDAKDYSGNGYHGTVTGAVLTGGGFDGKGAYRFDGVNNNFIRASHKPMNPIAHTISGWFKKCSNIKTSYPIFLSYTLPYIACDGAGLPFRVSYTGDGIQTHTAGGIVPVLNEWYYVAAVFDVGGVSLFVNGEFQAINTTPCGDTSTTFDMGRHLSSSTYQIDGEICNVKIFNRALTPEEIAVEYKRTGVSKMTQHNGTVYIQGQVKETI